MAKGIGRNGRKPALRLLNVLDLFAGCGALSAGLLQAGGFRIVAACEWNHFAAAAYTLNHPGTIVIEDDITTEETKQAVCGAFANRRCDVVMGGPPCQCFSTSGKRDPDDPRLMLHEHFVDVTMRLNPSLVVIENVSDIMSMRFSDGTTVPDRIAVMLKSLGYAVGYRMLNAANFGVPQRRLRIFILGKVSPCA